MNVPFLDLQAQHRSIRTELEAAIGEVLDSCAFAGGPFVERFEKEWAAFCGVRQAIGVGNGTDALWLILQALGVKAGDEVITVPNTFIATAEAISLCGAQPVFVDVDPVTYTMDPKLLGAAITTRTRAIIPVHLFGQTADMDPILEVARRRSIPVVEDACQAHGAEYKGRKAGSMGVAAAFSFYPGKNLGACGEAGAIVTNDDELARKARIIRDHGQSRKYIHAIVGWNARMDGIQAAVLSVKLRHVQDWNDRRRRNALVYTELLMGVEGAVPPVEAPYGRHVYHVYAVRVPNRDDVLSALKEKGISCAVHYPIPIHLQDAYGGLGLGKGSFPCAESGAGEFLSLPMFPELTRDAISFICESLVGAMGRMVRA
jgi:dTDP-4-amino-4,6-dideoxygalactose transaminase